MTNGRKKIVKKKQVLRERVWEHSWLILPTGVIALVIVLGFIKAGKEPEGLLESFSVTTPGKQLPPTSKNITLVGTPIPQLGRTHVPVTEKVKYNSNPPTSGPHYDTPAPWGIYDKAPLDEQLVHNLEHGGIIISYHPAQIQAKELEKLRQQTRQLQKINPRIILTPRINLDTKIAVTAWGYLQKLENYDSKQIEAFYKAHVARAPECQKGQCPP
ncbi:MAG: DUF3105 domain-containing protein [Cyanobacteria bacterium J083]|nr:MAG: DUF3105 domain-containing protein [Cyanobacteria bacterium J083]